MQRRKRGEVQRVRIADIQAVPETSRTTLEVTSQSPCGGLSQNELGEGAVPLGSQGPQNIKTRPFSGTVKGNHCLCAFPPIGRVDPVVSSIPVYRLSRRRPPRSTAAAGSLGRPEGSTTDPQRGCGAACRRCKDVGYWPRSAGSRGRIQATQSMAAPRVLGAPGPHGAGLSAWCSRASAPRRVGCNRRDTWLLSARICPLMKDETPSACPCQLLSAPRELRDLKESVG